MGKRYKIPRRNSLSDDILDMGPIEDAIAAQDAASAEIARRVVALESRPVAKASAASTGGGGSGGIWDGGSRMTGSEILDMGTRL